ncbi:MAG TPA: MarR family winged helix-turn-helix transcriptional regulator [Thermoleophilaceae bacterium]|nr:MarR family winged helix-turn-helix transcriptional regulator [Thermoleophilaceae bacterium]
MSDAPALAPSVPETSPRSVGFLLSQLGLASSKRFAEALRPLGVHPGEFALMRYVEASEGQSQQALAERLGIPPSRMVAKVDSLEERGLVERRSDPADRRVRALHLTPKGRRVLKRAGEVAVDHESRLTADLAPGDREQLVDLLQRLQPGLVELRGVHPGLG